jgi:putative hydrolase of the HAD superfamily
MITTALFDLDETLLDRDASIKQIAQDQHHRLLNDGSIDSTDFIDTFLELDANGLTPRPDLYVKLVDRLHLELPSNDLLSDFNCNAWKSPVLFEGVNTLLTELSNKGTRLGVITNGSELSQKAKLLNSGIADLIDHYIISGVFGKHKPDPDIFNSMLESIKANADECVFIGDNPQADIMGAHNVGMQTVWVSENKSWPDDVKPVYDWKISHVTEILELPIKW